MDDSFSPVDCTLKAVTVEDARLDQLHARDSVQIRGVAGRQIVERHHRRTAAPHERATEIGANETCPAGNDDLHLVLLSLDTEEHVMTLLLAQAGQPFLHRPTGGAF